MTIKKNLSAPAAEAPSAPASGGATIADRFKLDLSEPAAKPKKGDALTAVALVAGLAALAVAGILVFTLYQHWEFLKTA